MLHISSSYLSEAVFRRVNSLKIDTFVNGYAGNVLCRPTTDFFSPEHDEFEDLKLQDLVPVKTFAKGTWGKLQLVHIKNEPTRCFALKKMPRSKLTRVTARRRVFNEKQILSSIKSDFIVEFHKAFHNSTHLFILMEWCPGGDLSLIYGKGLDEAASLFYVGCIVEAVECLHSKNIIHRDLKPKNFVLDNKGYLKLIDFGTAKRLNEKKRTRTLCGTYEYCAPEIVLASDGSYDYAADLYAIGLITYEVLTGSHPMTSHNKLAVCKKIIDGMDDAPFLNHISIEGIAFIKRLCKKIPEERLGYGPGGFGKLRNHRWFRPLDVKALRNKTLAPPFVPKLDGVMDTRYFTDHVSDDDTYDSLDVEIDPAWADDF